jgi:hypothetical protein
MIITGLLEVKAAFFRRSANYVSGHFSGVARLGAKPGQADTNPALATI